MTAGTVRYGTPGGRWILVATILGSGIASLDATVVNVALPAIGEDLGADVAGLQWVLTGYLLTLASLILLGGALGDRFGRRRIFVVGVAWFTLASLLCGVAPNLPTLVAARALQGIGGALLTPGSLAIIEASFAEEDRGRAIGAWSGLSGVATAIGPLFGGYLVDAVSWRLIFLLNLPLAAIVLVASRHVPETRGGTMAERLDLAGSVLVTVGLAGVTYALIEAPGSGSDAPVVVMAVIGVAALVAFVAVERRRPFALLPLSLFSSRQFSAANLTTVVLYAALSGVFFLLAVHLQQVLGYSPLEAGAAVLPVTILMLLFSSRAGALSQRIGPRLPMSLGPVIVAVGLALMVPIDDGTAYLTGVLPSVLIFGAGLSLFVAPLTTTVLGAAPSEHAGIASGVNNAVARAAGLLAIAMLPAVSGLSGAAYEDPVVFAAGFRTAMWICVGLVAAGALISWVGIRNPPTVPSEEREHPDSHCALDAPPLRAGQHR